jgi:hypothetical protein
MKPLGLQKEFADEFEAWDSSRREPGDFCSRDGALALKEKIEAYWRERGHNVMVALHNVGFHPAIRAARFDVRSDMINGMPRPANSSRRTPEPPEENFVEELETEEYLAVE